MTCTLPLKYNQTQKPTSYHAHKTLFQKRQRTFTGKGFYAKTDRYYYEARYLDPRTSRWLGVDPAMHQGDYIPSAPIDDEARKRNGNLPNGGIYNHINLHTFNYSNNNPVKYTDPDGRVPDFEFSEVYAPADGTIFAINNFANSSDYGNYIIMEHDDGRFSLFAHLEGARTGLKKGDRVTQGEVFATGGGTGKIKGMLPHLHWSVFEGVNELKSDSDTAIFNNNWFVNSKKTVDPEILVDSGAYRHPSLGEITDPFGTTGSTLRKGPHEGIDYSLVRRRKE